MPLRKEVFWLVILTVYLVAVNSIPCHEYGCHHHHYHHHPQPFLPAPPGKTPSCAKHGSTYCEKVEHYPSHVIRFLVEKWQYDVQSIFMNERRDVRTKPVYGPPPRGPYQGGPYSYGPSRQPHYGGYPQQLVPPPAPPSFTVGYNQTQFEGYPDRRYPLGNIQQDLFNDDPGYIYSAILQTDVTHYEPNVWWKRYARSTRQKRQLGNNLQLCPTQSQFIMPKAALNNRGNWMYVVNLEQNNYTQLVRSETCISSQCNGICNLPNGYTSRCEQQYVQKRLVALDGSGSNLYTDLFWLPHCCICQITQVR